MIKDLTELATLDDVIKAVSRNLRLPSETKRHLEKWANSPHLLKKGVPSTFRKTFEMKEGDPALSKLKLGQRIGERTKLKKVKNLIIGWLAEEIASVALRTNNTVLTVEPSGVDVERTVELARTPTDPDYRVRLRNQQVLFVEVVSIGKVGDGVIRMKYNKVKRNLMRYFGLSKGQSAHWREHFLNPCIYLCVDLISKTGGFIVEGANFYTKQFPVRYAGWENQEVVVFDTRKRLTYAEFSAFDLQKLRQETISKIRKEFTRLHKVVEILGNPLLIDRNHRVRVFLRKLFELDHSLSLRKRREAMEAKELSKMKRSIIKMFKELPTEYQRKLFPLVKVQL